MMKNYIRQHIPVCELLAGLAEECAELAQAALKLRRVYDGTNPTPADPEDAYDKFVAEIADVEIYLDQMDINLKEVARIKSEKADRWIKRIEERCGDVKT